MEAEGAPPRLDGFYGGRLRLWQREDGYRVNHDTVLLGAAVTAPVDGPLAEAGCGVGGAMLIAALRFPSAHLIGLERDAGAAALARRNCAENHCADRVQVLIGDAAEPPEELRGLGGVFFNPPFDPPGRGWAPAPARRAAHIADAPLEAWVLPFVDRLRGGAAMTVIHRAEALPALLAALEGRLGGVRVLPVQAFEDEPAKRVLVRAVKGSRAPFALLAPLVLHERPSGAATAQAAAILSGGAPISWSS